MSGLATSIIRLSYGIIIVSLVTSIVVSYQSIESLFESGTWTTTTEVALLEIEQTFSLLKDAETGQRGYLLTGDENYLEPYRSAVPRIEQHLDRLAKLSADHPEDLSRVDELRREVAEKLAELRMTIALRKEKGFETALKVVQGGRGKRAMDTARRLLAEMKQEESHRVALRTAVRNCFTTVCIVVLLTLMLIVWSKTSLPARIGPHDRA